jgi:hypothetical protein
MTDAKAALARRTAAIAAAVARRVSPCR